MITNKYLRRMIDSMHYDLIELKRELERQRESESKQRGMEF